MAVVRLDNRLVLVLDALQETGLGEDELELTLDSSVYFFAAGHCLMNSVRLPLYVTSLRVS